MIQDVQGIQALCVKILGDLEVAGGVPWRDVTAQMPINEEPFHPDFVRWLKPKYGNVWPTRELSSIAGVSLHHSMSHSPQATARYCCFTKGYPSIQYHLWVSAGEGCPVYLCAPLEWMIWNDSSGGWQPVVSVAMAGRWDHDAPSQEQIETTAVLCSYLAGQFFRGERSNIRGHKDRARRGVTVCPGWDGPNVHRSVDLWRSRFYEALA